jgi:hypothetical protein
VLIFTLNNIDGGRAIIIIMIIILSCARIFGTRLNEWREKGEMWVFGYYYEWGTPRKEVVVVLVRREGREARIVDDDAQQLTRFGFLGWMCARIDS